MKSDKRVCLNCGTKFKSFTVKFCPGTECKKNYLKWLAKFCIQNSQNHSQVAIGEGESVSEREIMNLSF